MSIIAFNCTHFSHGHMFRFVFVFIPICHIPFLLILMDANSHLYVETADGGRAANIPNGIYFDSEN